ncbi:MAG: hypothetical protein EOO02_18615 [Chitinophagaceae bacterium]|nr:MAG: hypothetical protein EOO02_18615 [Chitinophagaceae bacterium]
MSKKFYQHIFDKQQGVEAVPPNETIASWALRLIHLLYPEKAEYFPETVAELEKAAMFLEKELVRILNATKACAQCDNV